MLIGALAGYQPRLALVTVFALVFVVVALSSLTLGTCLFATLWFFSEVLPSGGLPVVKLMGILLVGSWLASVTVGANRRRRLFESSRFLYLVLAFILWVAMSALWAPHPGAALAAVSRYAPNAMLFPIVYVAIRRRDDALLLVGALVLGTLAAAAFGLVFPIEGEEPGRLAGALGNANNTAASLVVALALLGGLIAALGDRPWLRGIVALGVPFCVFAILLTVSRGGMVALAAMLVVTAVIAKRWRKVIVASAVIVVAAGVVYFVALAPTAARERVAHPEGGTGRVDIWTVGWRMVEAHPITGVGAGNFVTSSVDYLLRPGVIHRADFIVDNPKVAHNTYLQLLAELGIVGLLLFLTIVASVLRFAARAARMFLAAGDSEMATLSQAILIAIVGYLIASFFDSREFSSDLWLLMSLAAAMLGLARAEASERQVSEPRSLAALPAPAAIPT